MIDINNKEIPIVLGMDAFSVNKMKIIVKAIKTHIPNAKIYLITDREVEVDWADEIKIFLITGITNCGKKYVTPHSLYPLYIDLLFPELEKCIYLEYDMLVLDDISELLEGDDWTLKAAKSINSNEISSGILVMNLKDEKFIKCIKRCRMNLKNELSCGNIFNANFGNNITLLDKSYNVYSHNLYNSIKNPKIIHYSGQEKPFNVNKLWKHYYKFVN